MFNLRELMKRVIKYLVEGIMVALAALVIPTQRLNMNEVTLLALTAAATFSILDTFIPTMAASTRQGAGLGIGFNMVGGIAGL
jgi:hypothetical protein